MTRLSIRIRLWLTVGLTAGVLTSIVVADTWTTTGLQNHLAELQNDYLPLLEYGPELEGRLERISRAMQDAVAAQDEEALAAVDSLRQQLMTRLQEAPSQVDLQQLETARAAFLDWYSHAYRVSERLQAGETGEELVVAIAAMHVKQRSTWESLRATVYLDRKRMAAVFAEVGQAQQDASQTRLLLGGALLLLLVLLSASTVRRVTTGVDALRLGMERIGGGDLAARVHISSGDELAALADQANQMAEQLQAAEAGLQKQQRALEEANRGLEEANRELEAFSYSVSHDLRAPLRGIDGFSQALLEDYAGALDHNGQGYLHRVRAAAQRMGELIDDLLKLSRLGRAELRREPVDVTALARGVLQQIQSREPERAVSVEVADGLEARADRRLLTAVLENLLNNAWKFTSKTAAPRIEVTTTHVDGERAYVVRDNGAGFDMQFASRLFGAFQRLHSTHEYEGTGIGLATVQRIIRRHGGRIWANAAVGRGASFFFTLPDGGAS